MSLLSRLLNFQGGSVRLEDFLTDILAYLLSAYPDLCLAWLDQSGVLSPDNRYSQLNITTQVSFEALEEHQHASRLDIVIRLSEVVTSEVANDRDPDEVLVPPADIVFIESKVGSREGEDQLRRYAEQLAALPDARHRKLVYMTRDYDPKDKDRIVSGLHRSRTPADFSQARWHEFYKTLEDYRSTSLPQSDLIQEGLLFMQQHGMSATNRLSAADVVVLSGMTRMLAFMRETLSDEIAARLREVSGKRLARRGEPLKKLAEEDRYILQAIMGAEFWSGAGFYLGQDDPTDYPWLTVLLEVGPRQPGREDIISDMRSFAADHPHCAPYDLEDSPAWSGLEWSIDLRELLTAEDHLTAARNFFLQSLDNVSRVREQYPDLPWARETSG